jgi:hypothetical protein
MCLVNDVQLLGGSNVRPIRQRHDGGRKWVRRAVAKVAEAITDSIEAYYSADDGMLYIASLP